jgi:hypothetical protein
MELELATTDELIKELLNRSTFRGLIVYQQHNFKGPCETTWRWEARHCEPLEIIDQLGSHFEEMS